MFIEVQITFPDEESAVKIAEKLLDERLVACVQIVPIESFYTWEGKREHSPERLAIAKTRRGLFSQIAQLVESLHPYLCPQITAIQIVEVNAPYANWMIENTREPVCMGEV
ncbi:MAG: divalent-cation tolerance protein CutA [Thermoguttaceae bacterium]